MHAGVIDSLNFTSAMASAIVLHDADKHPITERSVVINVAATDAHTGKGQLAPLPPLSSTVLLNATVTGALLIIISVDDTAVRERVARDLGWTDFYGPGGPVLLKSPQHTIGTVLLDRASVLHQAGLSSEPSPHTLKVNLWFSPEQTDCGIHNEHAFIEVHTQIAGLGRMQKFDTKSHETLYEDQLLSPGTTNPIPFGADVDGELVYPWHQYRADTDCVWLALEYHEL
jgi:hypothetical protein